MNTDSVADTHFQNFKWILVHSFLTNSLLEDKYACPRQQNQQQIILWFGDIFNFVFES